MSSPGETRPRQVTMAGGMVVVGSVLVVISAFERMAGLRSLEMRERVEAALAEPPGSGLGLGVSDVLDVLGVLIMVAAACATVSAFLGYQALQRSRSARRALSVLAVPLAVTGTAAGGAIAIFVAAAVLMLWLQPARDWYDGRTPADAARTSPDRPADRHAPDRHADRAVPERPAPDRPVPDQQPASAPTARPYVGYGATPDGPEAAAGAVPPGATAHGATARTPRPAAVLWACAVASTSAVLVAVGMVTSTVALLREPELLLAEIGRQDPRLAEEVSRDLVVASTVVLVAVVVAWCLVAVVFAWFASRGAPWARIALLVSAGLAGGVCLLGMLAGNLALVVPFAACALTTALLSRPESRRWFADRGSMRA